LTALTSPKVTVRNAFESERSENAVVRYRGHGPNITASFDKQYPHIAELIENQMLDEQDDAGSLCEFITADEWSSGDEMIVDG
jgi:hypothetical protein